MLITCLNIQNCHQLRSAETSCFSERCFIIRNEVIEELPLNIFKCRATDTFLRKKYQLRMPVIFWGMIMVVL